MSESWKWLTAQQFAEEFELVRPALLRLARRRLMRREDAEDAVQNVAAWALCNLERYDVASGQAALVTWLAHALRYKIFEMNARHFPDNLDPDVLQEEVEARQEDTGELTVDVNSARQVMESVTLKERQRRIFDLWLEGHTHQQIGEAVGCHRVTVGYHLGIVHTRLAEQAERVSCATDAYRLFAFCSRVARYHRPTRRGAWGASARLRRLR